MDATAARTFDRTRDFAAYLRADIIGAALWCTKILRDTSVLSTPLTPLIDMLASPPSSDSEPGIRADLQAYAEPLMRLGCWLSGAAAEMDIEMPARVPAPLLVGTITVEPANPELSTIMRPVAALKTTMPLRRQLCLEVGGQRYLLVCADEALEAIGGDLSVFEGTFPVAVRGWPAGHNKIFVEEACPMIPYEGLTSGDWAHGRIFDNGQPSSPLVLRVNRDLQIALLDEDMQTLLRPWVGTAVCVYGKRAVDPEARQQTLRQMRPDMWMLCRLTDPEDTAASIARAPEPHLQTSGKALFIGGTPPWNWQGPNVRTHLLAPAAARGLRRITERRLVFGSILPRLPENTQNHYPEIKRVFDVSYLAERDTDTEAHWTSRLAPIEKPRRDLRGFAALTFASALVPNTGTS